MQPGITVGKCLHPTVRCGTGEQSVGTTLLGVPSTRGRTEASWQLLHRQGNLFKTGTNNTVLRSLWHTV